MSARCGPVSPGYLGLECVSEGVTQAAPYRPQFPALQASPRAVSVSSKHGRLPLEPVNPKAASGHHDAFWDLVLEVTHLHFCGDLWLHR